LFLLCVGFVVWMYEMSKRIGYCMTVLRGAVLLVARPVPPEEQSVRSTKCPTICAFFISVNLYIHESIAVSRCMLRKINNDFLFFFYWKSYTQLRTKRRQNRKKTIAHHFCKLIRRVSQIYMLYKRRYDR